MFFMGILFAGGGIYLWRTSPLYSKTSVKVDAVIADIQTNMNSDRRPVYAAVLEYSFGGQLIRNTSDTFSSFKPEVGKKIQILINPAKPDNPMQKNFMNYAFPWIFVIIGVGLLVLPLI